MDNDLKATQRIAKNTIFLYFRMLITMGVSLYTVRIVLNVLGIEDYGIYNVVGGIVTMFAFLNSTLAASSQRFFSYELGRNNMGGLADIFSLNVTIFVFFVVVVVVVAETAGLWFINTRLQIPVERMGAANWVYQFSILSFVTTILSVPYNALIIAHEKMSAFAYISIVEVLLKLGIVLGLSFVSVDKLKLYGLLMFIVSAITYYSYYGYCRFFFKESRYIFFWNKQRAVELLSYSGWHFIGSFSVIIRSQGINILLNMFFNPAINAARAIAYQVNTAIDALSTNFFTAVKPHIYKLYSTGEVEKMNSLVLWSTKYCFFLMLILAMPIYLEIVYLLELWLKEVPEYTIVFTRLVIINALIDSTNGPAIASALATGNIKKMELVTGFLMFLNLPISYVFLKIGGNADITMIVSIFLSVVTVFVRAFILKELTGLSLRSYCLNVCFSLCAVSLLSFLAPLFLHLSMDEGILRLLLVSFVCFFSIMISFYFVGLSSSEKLYLRAYIYRRSYRK